VFVSNGRFRQWDALVEPIKQPVDGGIERGYGCGSNTVGVKFVPSALNDAVQDILAILYSDLRLDTRSRDELIRKRYAAGERISDLAREFGITPQHVHQIVNDKQK
jgi:hypothetical protein